MVTGPCCTFDESPMPGLPSHHYKRLFSPGVPSQPALKLPAFAAPVTAVAFAPASCGSSRPQRSGMNVLAVGLESGGLQLWGLHRKAKDSASGYTGGLLQMPVCYILIPYPLYTLYMLILYPYPPWTRAYLLPCFHCI